jgi:protocatechuate 3,4-dioxygenase beta subunit
MTTLTPGQRMSGLELKLQPQAVIAGRVLDEHGEPIARAAVMVMGYVYAPWGRQLSPRSSATTNDLGEYRAFGLPPGRYYIAATYRSNLSMATTSEDRSAAPPPEEAYATTYYPGTTDMQSAAQVEAAPGAVVESINLQLAKSPAVRVRGSVAGLSGAAVPYAMVNLTRTGDMASYTMGSMGASAIQGQFEFRGVTSGRYTLIATNADGQKQLQGRQMVDVGSVNVENVTITLGTGFDLPGSVRLDGQTQVGLQTLLILLQPTESGIGGNSGPGHVDKDGNFVLTGVWPGRYLVRVSAPVNFYVKSQRLGSEDVLETPLDLTGGSAGALSIVLGISTGEVSGTVTSEDGTPVASAMVVLIPESAKRRELQDSYRLMTTGQAGGYKLTGVAPGRYKLFAWEKISNGAWMDPDILKPVESQGKPVDIRETSKDTVNLRALPAVQ